MTSAEANRHPENDLELLRFDLRNARDEIQRLQQINHVLRRMLLAAIGEK